MVIDEAFRPRLRPVEPHWIVQDGQPVLVLRDRLGISEKIVAVPGPLATLLALCDGRRTVNELRLAFELRTGIPLSPTRLRQILAQLDEALLLDSPRFAAACAAALAEYRAAPYRPPALAGTVYPAEPTTAATALAAYATQPQVGALPVDPAVPQWTGEALPGQLCGIISPHIDYQRGGPLYARLWQAAAPALAEAEVAVVFGTDHCGGPGQVTLTRQSYATPWGVLPTDRETVETLATVLGEEAFAEELHHRKEHSVELAVVWLHYARQGRPLPLVPILCGSFHPYTEGEAEAAAEPRFARLIETLTRCLAGRRAVVVAAADLAHVGPAFGDPHPLTLAERRALRQADMALLGAIGAGDPEAFLGVIRAGRDRYRICGLPPIYLALRLLAGRARGLVTGYAHCPADAQNGSVVSIAGVLLVA